METLTNEATVILALAEGPACGVELMGRGGRAGAGRSALRAGTLYPLLRRLEKAGLVRSWLEGGRSRVGRPRRFVELTANGITLLGQVREQLRAVEPAASPADPRSSGRVLRANLFRAFRVSAFALRLRDAGAR